MTNIAQTVASKALVAIVAAAMIFTMFAPAAQAQTTEELQKMINDLMAQIAALQGQGGTSTSASGVCPFTWTRDLNTGATGADVMKLQQFLNANADTRVAASGAGSVGMETEYYGPATAAAVSKFQVMYRADVLTPNGLVNPTGYFGPSTRNKANSLCMTAPTTPTTPTTPGGDDEDEDELQGEGELDVFEMDDASDTEVEEGAEDVEIAEITMEATDGDIEVDRITFTLDGTGNDEDEPWEVFETISLWVDGDMIGEFEADDEDNYLDEDNGEFRFSGLGLILREDEEVEITVAASIQSNIDGAGSDATWTLEVTSVRYFDADGVATDDNDTDGISQDTATFDIVEEGEGEELKFSLSSSNPDAMDIIVDESKVTKGVTIMEYTIEAEDNDIELDTLYVNVQTSVTATTTDVVNDIVLIVDGKTFKDKAVVTDGDYSTTSVRYEFDIDGDVVIDEGEEVDVEVVVDFKSQESSNNEDRYSNGTQIRAQVSNTERDATKAEGADDIDEFKGTAIGEWHTVVAEGIVIPADSVSSDVTKVDSDGKIYQFDLEFDVTAVEGDFYITDNATTTNTDPADGVGYTVLGGSVTSVSAVLDSGAVENNGVFVVREGETETFTLTVTVDAAASASFRIQLDEVWYSENANGEGGEAYIPTPASDFRTKTQSIVG